MNILSNSKNSKFKVSDAFIIAAVPMVAYAFKFIYDASYGQYFGIPPELVTFSLSSVIPVVFLLSALFLSTFYMVGLIFHFKEEMNFVQIAYQNFAVLILLGLTAWLINNSRPYYLIFAVPALYILFRHMLLPIISHRKEKDYISKTNKHFSIAYKNADTPVDILFDFGMYRQSAVIIIILGLAFLTSIFASNRASTETTYYVLKSDNKNIAVRFIENRVVFAQIDKNNRLTGQLHVRNISDKDVVLVKKDIGKIRKF